MVDQPVGVPPEENQITPVKPKTKWWKLIPLLILVASLVSAVAIVIYQNKSTEMRRGATGPQGQVVNGDFSSTDTREITKTYATDWLRGTDNWGDYYSGIAKPYLADGTTPNPDYDAECKDQNGTPTCGNYLYMHSSAIPNDAWLRYEQTVSLAAGTSYTLSAKAKVLTTQGRGVTAIIADSNNNVISAATLTFGLKTPTAWETKTSTFTVPATGSYVVRLQPEDGSQAYWDEVSLAAAGGATAEKIVFSSNRDGNDEIYIMDSDGTNQTRLTDNSGYNYYPSFSPDGQKIVFNSGRDGNNEIYVMDSDGTNQTRLTDNSAYDYSPSFSPDGQKIVFNSDRDGNNEIYQMNADGTGQTNLTNNPAWDTYASFSPDGQQIVFNSDRDGNFEIYQMNADGTGPVNLTNNPANDQSPSFSPDGQQIVFNSNRDGNAVYVMNANGTGQTKLINDPLLESKPSFSPDGNYIVFTSTRDGNFEVYQINADGTGPVNLTNNPARDESNGRRVWVSVANTAELIVNSDFSSTATREITKTYATDWLRGTDNWGDYLSGILKPYLADGTTPNPDYDAECKDQNGIPICGNYLYMYSSSIPNGAWLRYEQSFYLEAGTYVLSAKAKVLLDQGRGVNAVMTCAEDNGCGALAMNELVPNSSIDFNLDPSWQTKTSTFTIDTPANYFVRLQPEDGSQAYFDEISLLNQAIAPTPTGTIPTPTLVPPGQNLPPTIDQISPAAFEKNSVVTFSTGVSDPNGAIDIERVYLGISNCNVDPGEGYSSNFERNLANYFGGYFNVPGSFWAAAHNNSDAACAGGQNGAETWTWAAPFTNAAGTAELTSVAWSEVGGGAGLVDWTVNFSGFPVGTYNFYAMVKDKSGLYQSGTNVAEWKKIGVVSVTEAAITITPTLPPTGDALTMKIHLEGIDEKGSDQLTRVTFRRDGQEVWTDDLSFTADNNGTYSITVDKPGELVAGNYEIFFKGRSHLQKQLPGVGQTMIIADGDTLLDFTTSGPGLAIRAGDVANHTEFDDQGNEIIIGDPVFHDNEIRMEDMTAIVIARGQAFSVPVTAETVSLDVNADGFITVQDIALAIMNWTDEIVPGDNW